MNEQSKEGIDGIPDDIYQHLMSMLKQHDHIVTWVHIQRPFLFGKSAIELLESGDDGDRIRELLTRSDTGDFS
mgnify:FL=1|tara:strand:- start:19248 stop:19466 length:219 start_codon:yes stop_codon:yes gene_type:complete